MKDTSAAHRLRRLRWLLTLLFTLLNAFGVVALAVAVIAVDADARKQKLDGDLQTVTAVVTRLLGVSEIGTNTAGLNDDPISTRCPQFALIGFGDEAIDEYRSKRDCVEVSSERVKLIAKQAAAERQSLPGWFDADDGEPARFVAHPLLTPDDELIGVVFAVADASEVNAQHNGIVAYVAFGGLALVILAGGVGYILAGRAIRPAAAALEQQEVLLAETAHDLRTPVAALRALAETAERNPDQRAELLPRTVRLAGRMGSIIDGLLVRARLAAGVEQLAIQPVWLDQLVSAVVEDTPAGGARLTVTAAACKVDADPALLQRAVSNLVDNALRYGKSPDRQQVVHVTVAGGRVTVSDNGPGIEQELAERAFDRFAGDGGSSGLGLSIVRWVALSHGGSLSVFNAEDGGAIFELTLPLSGSG